MEIPQPYSRTQPHPAHESTLPGSRTLPKRSKPHSPPRREPTYAEPGKPRTIKWKSSRRGYHQATSPSNDLHDLVVKVAHIARPGNAVGDVHLAAPGANDGSILDDFHLLRALCRRRLEHVQ